jgi:hypothetical protein
VNAACNVRHSSITGSPIIMFLSMVRLPPVQARLKIGAIDLDARQRSGPTHSRPEGLAEHGG